MSSNTPIIRRVPANRHGLDFVVGDLHGCRDLLDRLLAQAGFRPAQGDRLFAVGDLIDRGHGSLECLALLEEGWFFAVRGNHEQMLLDVFDSAEAYGVESPAARQALHFMEANGGGWLQAALRDRQRELLRMLPSIAELPHLIVVGEGRTRFHVVHAELPPTTTNADIDAAFPAHGNWPALTDYLLWSRHLMGRDGPVPEHRRGLSPTYCGHTVGIGIRRREGHVCLDTGSFVPLVEPHAGGFFGLTLLCAQTGQVWFESYRSEDECIAATA